MYFNIAKGMIILQLRSSSNQKTIAYLSLMFVVFIWGTGPVVTLHFYKYYSPSIRLFFVEIISFVTFSLLSLKHITKLNKEYIRTGLITGVFLALANISQKIGLMYSTPAKYAFLENLSCLAVPVITFFIIKKKPSPLTIASCIICFVSVFILNGISFSDKNWGIGEILCGLAGIFYGFNIALTGAKAKKFYAPLYLAVQTSVGIVVSLIFALALNTITTVNSSGVSIPIEQIRFSFNPCHIAFTIVYTIVSSAFCWIIRTNAMKHIDASVVSVIMPFSAVVTGIISVITGSDNLSANLAIGGMLSVLAMIIPGFENKRKSE